MWDPAQSEAQVFHPNRARFGNFETSITEQFDHFATIGTAVTVTEMAQRRFAVASRTLEVDYKYAAIGPHYSTQFPREFSSRSLTEVMQHQRGKRNVKIALRKGQRLGGSGFEADGSTRLFSFRSSPSNHLRRSVDRVDAAGRTHLLLRQDREGSGSAAHIEDRLARSKVH
jgi:hypothetical protein